MPRLRLLRFEDTVKPGNKMVTCLAKSYTVGQMKFRQNIPTEVTQRQLDGLMRENARLGRAIFREYLAKDRPVEKQRTSLTDLFEALPSKPLEEEPVIVPEFERAIMNEEEEVEDPEDSPRKVVGKRMTIKEGPTQGRRGSSQGMLKEVEDDDDSEETVVVRTRKKKAI